MKRYFHFQNWVWAIGLTSHWKVSALLSALLHVTLVSLFRSSSPSIPFILTPQPLATRLILFFPLTVRRYLKDQITMATISHIVITHTRVWWLFLFWRVCRCTLTSLAVCRVTCSGDEGTMLPSVGSVCLHTVTDSEKPPAPPVMTHDSQSHAN